MKKKSVFSLCLVVFVAIMGLLFFTTSGIAADKPINLRLAIHTAPGSIVYRITSAWAKEAEQKTEGRLKVTIFPSQSLVHLKDMFPATVKGVCDIGFSGLQMDASRYPLSLITGMGLMGWPSGQGPTQIWTELQKKFPQMEAENKGVKVLWQYVTMPMTLHFTKKVVRVPKDMEGLKIEAAGPLASAMKYFGATPVVTSPAEWYMALDRGLEDGICHNYAPLWSLKVHPILHKHTDVSFGLVGQVLIMNIEKWNSLPDDIKKIIDDMRPWSEKMSVDMSTEEADRVVGICKGLGHTFITPNADEMKLWFQAAKPMHEAWVAETEAKGLPGRAIFEETNRLIQKYKN